MKIQLKRYYKVLFSLIFGIIVFLFWDLFYPAFLSYQEQFQMFLFDHIYWSERISVPGGFADYIGEFFTQFNFNVWMGAIILAILYVILQRVMWILAKKESAKDIFYPLSVIPILLLWNYMSDESVLLSFVVAITMAISTYFCYLYIKNKWIKIIYLAVMTPFLFWVAGSVNFIFVGMVIIHEVAQIVHHTSDKKHISVVSIITLLILLLFYSIVIPILAYQFVPYPLHRLYSGINYYRIPDVPYSQYFVAFIFSIAPFVLGKLPKVNHKKTLCICIQIFILILGGYLYISKAFSQNTEDMMEYDYLTRNAKWDDIIKKADKASPKNPFGVTALNLALGMTNQLGDRMFNYYQNGTEGLLSNTNKDFISPLPVSEAYYRLGMINAAQRTTFEIMEAIPNYRKSGRLYKRLAETNIINGEYAVAAKYLHILQKTLFYKSWADYAMTYLYNDKKVSEHPEWGRLRQLTYSDDFLFSDKEMDMMLGLLFKHNHTNRMAFEYLMAYELLNRDLKNFYEFFPIGQYANFDHVPLSYQQALLFIWTQNHKDFNGIPWSINPEIAQEIIAFARTFSNEGKNSPSLKTYLGTYWYYLLVENS